MPSAVVNDAPPPTPPPKTVTGVSRVIVHPMVLLSVVDHFNRLQKTGYRRRTVGVMLGSCQSKGVLDVSNSFAVPFDEDPKDNEVWYIDSDYLETMYHMFKKVNAKEKIVGWYHTGPKLHSNDIKINDLMRTFCADSVLVIIDTESNSVGIPTEAYYSVEEVHDDGTPNVKTFEHVASEIGAEEAEEVGVEHLLRDIKDTVYGSLGERISQQLLGLRGLDQHLKQVKWYLEQVIAKRLPVNNTIIYHLQDMLNLLPDVKHGPLMTSLCTKTNDQYLVVYLASLVRSVIALDSLIENKLTNKDLEKAAIEGKSSTTKKEDDKKKEEKESSSKKKEKA